MMDEEGCYFARLLTKITMKKAWRRRKTRWTGSPFCTSPLLRVAGEYIMESRCLRPVQAEWTIQPRRFVTQLNSTQLHPSNQRLWQRESESESCLWTLLRDLSRKKKMVSLFPATNYEFCLVFFLSFPSGDYHTRVATWPWLRKCISKPQWTGTIVNIHGITINNPISFAPTMTLLTKYSRPGCKWHTVFLQDKLDHSS